MQTFLPYPDFKLCAQSLDNKRLNKQHVECYQIIDVLEGNSVAWKNHPAVRMWDGYIDALKAYANCVKDECLLRCFKSEKIPYFSTPEQICYPKWVGLKLVHESHKSNLARKLPSHYCPQGFVDYGITGYYWPVIPKTKRSRVINILWISMLSSVKEKNNV